MYTNICIDSTIVLNFSFTNVAFFFCSIFSHGECYGENWDQDQHHIRAAWFKLGRSDLTQKKKLFTVACRHICWLSGFCVWQSWPASFSLEWMTSTGSVLKIPIPCWTRVQLCSICGPAERERGPRVSGLTFLVHTTWRRSHKCCEVGFENSQQTQINSNDMHLHWV